MTWVRERDLLIAQTMEFVKSVTGQKPDADVRVEAAPSPDAIEPAVRETPAEAAERLRKPSVARSPVREEMERRVAAFRAHQQRFDRERDRHFASVLTKIRAATTDQPEPPTP